jgi:hypothetical protein
MRNGNYKHGRYTAEAKQNRQWITNQLRQARALIKDCVSFDPWAAVVAGLSFCAAGNASAA